jgi:hypothetical protein
VLQLLLLPGRRAQGFTFILFQQFLLACSSIGKLPIRRGARKACLQIWDQRIDAWASLKQKQQSNDVSTTTPIAHTGIMAASFFDGVAIP